MTPQLQILAKDPIFWESNKEALISYLLDSLEKHDLYLHKGEISTYQAQQAQQEILVWNLLKNVKITKQIIVSKK